MQGYKQLIFRRIKLFRILYPYKLHIFCIYCHHIMYSSNLKRITKTLIFKVLTNRNLLIYRKINPTFTRKSITKAMKKRTFKLALGVTSFIAASYFYAAQTSENYITELTSANIEALANPEDEYIDVLCLGEGAIDCYGEWVNRKYVNCR